MDETRIKETVKCLYNISQLFLDNDIKHWLDWGTLLHARRDKKLTVKDNDLDLGLLRCDYKKVLKVLKENNIQTEYYGRDNVRWPKMPIPEWYWKIHEYSNTIEEHTKSFMRVYDPRLDEFDHCDLYFWEDHPTHSLISDKIQYRHYVQFQQEIDSTLHSDLFCWAVDPWKPNKYLRRTKKYFVQELDTIDLYGYKFPCPRYVERFLDSRYGINWRAVLTYDEHWEYTKSGDEYRDLLKEDNITVFVEGVWDLFHQGHLQLLKRVHDIYDKVVVGIASDDLVRSYKRDPIIPYDDRVKMLEACRYVDEIYHNAPCLNITEKVLNKCGADYALHSVDDPNNWKVELRESARYNQSLIDSDRAHFLSYTGYHSSDIIDKILTDNK